MLIFAENFDYAEVPCPYHRFDSALVVSSTSAASVLDGAWTGTTVALVPPEGYPLFSVFLVHGRCSLPYSISPAAVTAGEDACSILCISNPACQFYSYGPVDQASKIASPANCSLFSFCVGESAPNCTTQRMFATAELIGALCKVDLTVRGLAVDLSIHSCDGADQATPGVRRSPQAGALHGIILPADQTGSENNPTSSSLACDALSSNTFPCEGLQNSHEQAAQPFSYWRLRIRWTGSSRDRMPGDVDNVIIAFDLNDGVEQWPLQLAMYPSSEGEPDPGTSFDIDFLGGNVSDSSEIISLEPQRASRLRLGPSVTPPVPEGKETAAITLLAAANVCSRALDSALLLAKSGSACMAAVAAFFPDAEATAAAAAAAGGSSSAGRINLAANECNNPCLPALTNATRAADSTCGKAFRDAPLKAAVQRVADDGAPVLAGFDPSVQILLSCLQHAADAVYLFEVACATNWQGDKCNQALQNSDACPMAVPPGRALDAAALQTLMLPVSPDGCGNCSAELMNYIYTDGCCVATLASAETRWADTVARVPQLGPWFWVNWSSELPLELFRPPDACPVPAPKGAGTVAEAKALAEISQAVVTIECRVSLCGLTSVWPDECCNNELCANGGAKVFYICSSEGMKVYRLKAPNLH